MASVHPVRPMRPPQSADARRRPSLPPRLLPVLLLPAAALGEAGPPPSGAAAGLLRAHGEALRLLQSGGPPDAARAALARRAEALRSYAAAAEPADAAGRWGWGGRRLAALAEEIADACAAPAGDAAGCGELAEGLHDVELRCARYGLPVPTRLPGAVAGLCAAEGGAPLRVHFPERGHPAFSASPRQQAWTRLLLLPVPRNGSCGSPSCRMIAVAPLGQLEELRPMRRRAHPLFPQESPTGWKAKHVPKTGTMKILILSVEFPDVPGWPKDSQGNDLHANKQYHLVYDSKGDMDQFFSDNSNGKLSSSAHVHDAKLFKARSPTTYYSSNSVYIDELLPETLEQATAAGIPIGDYDNWVVATTNIPTAGYAGLGLLGWAGAHSNGADHLFTMGHEFGHNLGRSHAKTKEPLQEYGNKFDIMGAGGGANNPHFGTHAKVGFGWIDHVADVIDVGAQSGTYRLYRHDHHQAAGHRAIRMGWDWHKRYFWLEYRAAAGLKCSGCDAGKYPWVPPTASAALSLVPGVLITQETGIPHSPVVDGDDSQLIDATPSTPITTTESMVDVTVAVGASHTLYADGGSSGARYAVVSVTGQGGTAPREWLDVQIDYVRDACPFPAASAETPPCGDRCLHDQVPPGVSTMSTSLSPVPEFAFDFEIAGGKEAAGISAVVVTSKGSATMTGVQVAVYADSSGKPGGSALGTATYSGLSLSPPYEIRPAAADPVGSLKLQSGRYWLALKLTFSGTFRIAIVNPNDPTLFPHGTSSVEKSSEAWAGWEIYGKQVEIAASVSLTCTAAAVAPASASFSQQPPASVTAGQTFTVEVRFLDVGGTPVALSSGTTVDLSIDTNPGAAHLPAAHSVTADGFSKSYSFSVSLDHGGKGYVLAAQASGLSLKATSNSFDVDGGTLKQVFSLSFPSSGAFVSHPGQSGLRAEHKAPLSPPAKVIVLDSEGKQDASAAGLKVTASSDVALSGALTVACDAQGVATFADLAFAECDAAGGGHYLNFTADPSSSFPVAGKAIAAGSVEVTGAAAGGLRFAKSGSLFAAPGQKGGATEGAAMSPVRLELLDSCGKEDTAGSVAVSVTASASAGTLSGATASFASGIAVFSALTFSAAPPGGATATITFTASAPGAPVDGLSVVTGAVTVKAPGVPGSNIMFAPETPMDQPMSVVEGEPTTVKVWLTDDHGNHDVVSSGVSVSCTSSASELTVEGGTGAIKAGTGEVALELVLRAAGGKCPSGAVTLTCAATAAALPANGKTIDSAAVTVVGAPAALFVLAATLPQKLTSQQPFPDISLELRDSCGGKDVATEHIDAAISVTPSPPVLKAAGSLCGGQPCAPFVRGIAVLHGVEPVVPPCPSAPLQVTFRALNMTPAAGAHRVVGTTVDGGAVAIEAAPLDRLVFASGSALQASADASIQGLQVPSARLQIADGCGQAPTAPVPHAQVTVSAVDGTSDEPDRQVVFRGGHATLDDAGLAVFDHIEFAACPDGAPQLVFSIEAVGGINAQPASTGHITVVPVPSVQLAFSAHHDSFFTAQHKHRVVVVNEPLPQVVLVTTDSCGVPDPPSVAPTLTVQASAPHVTLSGATATFTGGKATFTALTFETPYTEDVRITFTPSGGGSALSPIHSGDITVSNASLPAANMNFRSTASFWTKELQEANASLGVPLGKGADPVVLELQTSAHQPDTATTGLNVTATADGAVLVGASCLFQSGLCTLPDLAFSSCPAKPTPIVFTANSDTLAVGGHFLTSGAVQVTGAPRTQLRFAAGSFFSQSGQSRGASLHVTIPQTTVFVADACGAPEYGHELDGEYVRVRGSGMRSGTRAALSGGHAVFDRMVFDAVPTPNPAPLVFDLTLPDGRVLNVTTGPVEVQSDVTFRSNIHFAAAGSAVTEQNQPLAATVGTVLPAILVEMEDSAHYRDTTDSTTVVKAAVPDGSVALAGATVTMLNGIAEFKGLSFTGCRDPKAASPTFALSFVAAAPGAAADGQEIHTGAVSLSGRPGRSLRFAVGSDVTGKDTVLDPEHGHPVIVESLDECGAPDGLSGWTVSGSGLPSGSPQLGCTAAQGKCTIQLGTGVLSALRGSAFTLTLTAATTARTELAGKTATSGTITIPAGPSAAPTPVPGLSPTTVPSQAAASPTAAPSAAPFTAGTPSASPAPPPPGTAPTASPAAAGAGCAAAPCVGLAQRCVPAAGSFRCLCDLPWQGAAEGQPADCVPSAAALSARYLAVKFRAAWPPWVAGQEAEWLRRLRATLLSVFAQSADPPPGLNVTYLCPLDDGELKPVQGSGTAAAQSCLSPMQRGWLSPRRAPRVLQSSETDIATLTQKRKGVFAELQISAASDGAAEKAAQAIKEDLAKAAANSSSAVRNPANPASPEKLLLLAPITFQRSNSVAEDTTEFHAAAFSEDAIGRWDEGQPVAAPDDSGGGSSPLPIIIIAATVCLIALAGAFFAYQRQKRSSVSVAEFARACELEDLSNASLSNTVYSQQSGAKQTPAQRSPRLPLAASAASLQTQTPTPPNPAAPDRSREGSPPPLDGTIGLGEPVVSYLPQAGQSPGPSRQSTDALPPPAGLGTPQYPARRTGPAAAPRLPHHRNRGLSGAGGSPAQQLRGAQPSPQPRGLRRLPSRERSPELGSPQSSPQRGMRPARGSVISEPGARLKASPTTGAAKPKSLAATYRM